jgi:hypothetical protein
MAKQLQLPVRPGGEPVVVVPVQGDRRVGPDAALAQQLAELCAAGDVSTDPVRELLVQFQPTAPGMWLWS